MSMSDAHPLDRPVWSALASRQRGLSLGDGRARRFAPEYGPFGAAVDLEPESIALVVALGPPGVALVETTPVAPPPGARVITQAEVCQMIAEGFAPGDPTAEAAALGAAPLGDDDAAEMQALTALTQPGPFSTRTHQLGDFFGIRHGAALAAMAGERMQPDGFCEVSGVCTHPNWRGRGYAAGLTRLMAGRIAARGEIPFLHVMATNSGAIRVYETLGFVLRRTLILTVLAPALS